MGRTTDAGRSGCYAGIGTRVPEADRAIGMGVRSETAQLKEAAGVGKCFCKIFSLIIGKSGALVVQELAVKHTGPSLIVQFRDTEF